jgi:hypothetical protein
MAGARTEKREVLPYANVDGFLVSLRYRHSTNSKYQEIESSPKSIVVPVDDLRSIPRHELGIVFDEAALPAVYRKNMERLSLVVLTRDPRLRKDSILYQAPIKGLPESFVLDPAKLRETSCRTQLPIELSICALKTEKSAQWHKRRASRLLSWNLNIVNSSKGPRFPWVLKTTEDFKKAGLPANSTYFMNLLAEPEELLNDSDSHVEDLLEVWVHEDMWLVLQQSDANAGVAGLQRWFVAQVATQILEIVAASLRKNKEVVEGSVFEQLIEYVANSVKVDSEILQQVLRKESGTLEIAAYVFAAFGVNKAVARILDQ